MVLNLVLDQTSQARRFGTIKLRQGIRLPILPPIMITVPSWLRSPTFHDFPLHPARWKNIYRAFKAMDVMMEVQALLKLISVAKDVDIKTATETSALNKVRMKHLAWILPPTQNTKGKWKLQKANSSKHEHSVITTYMTWSVRWKHQLRNSTNDFSNNPWKVRLSTRQPFTLPSGSFWYHCSADCSHCN